MINFDWLKEWYKTQCDGDWEHQHGLKISTLDNPGWSIKIDLEGTPLQDKTFERIEIDTSDDDWIFCWVENNFFEGVGDPNKLKEIISIFKNWVEH